MIVLTDTSFHAKTRDPANMQVGARGTWNTRMLVETVLSMLTTVFHRKPVGHRVWACFRARVAWAMAAFNLLAWWGLEIDDEGHGSSVHCRVQSTALISTPMVTAGRGAALKTGDCF
jgi:hypothetical protein